MKKQPAQILFVYNVDLTPFALLSDFVHRIVSPETYPCRLCDLTYDRFTMKSEWKQFLASLPIDCAFALRDQFHRKYPAHADLPVLSSSPESRLPYRCRRVVSSWSRFGRVSPPAAGRAPRPECRSPR